MPRIIRAAAAGSFFRARFLLFQKRRLNTMVVEKLGDLDLLVLPGVLNPRIFLSGRIFFNALEKGRVPLGARVLDLGTGSGCCALAAARRGARVTAVDINPRAVECARINASIHDLSHRIKVRRGDLFAPVAGEAFDTVLFNPPFFRGRPSAIEEHAWYYNDLPRRFAASLRNHLNPSGFCLLLLSTKGECGAYSSALEAGGFALYPVFRKDLWSEVITIYHVFPRSGHNESA